MRACLLGMGAIVLLTGVMGCAMCGSEFDETYGAYGGRQPRTDRMVGRVGSNFHPSGGDVEAAPEPSAELPTTIEPQTDYESEEANGEIY